MDTQLAQLKRLNKNQNEIIYPHNGEIIIYRRETAENGEVFFTESKIKTETGITVKRKMRPDEMTVEQFDLIKPILDEETRTSFNKDWLETYLNVCFESLEETDLACVPSPETEMIDEIDRIEEEAREEADKDNPLRRTPENAEQILDACLTPTQKERYLMYKRDEKSSYEIGDELNLHHSTVLESIKAAERKIEKYFRKATDKA